MSHAGIITAHALIWLAITLCGVALWKETTR